MPETQADNDFPYTVVEREDGASRVRLNALYGIEVFQVPAGNDAGSTSFKVSRRPGDDGMPTVVLVDRHDLPNAQMAYARLWMDAVAVDVGLGFHPDTPAAGYAPPLEAGLAAQYDAMIEFCHRHLEDPYATAMEAWEEAGLVSPSPGS